MELTNLFAHRAISPVFNFFHTNADNFESAAFGGQPITGLIDPAIADGYWLMLEPLPPGPHVIRFGGALPFFSPTEITDYILVTSVPPADQLQQLILAVTTGEIPPARKKQMLTTLRIAKGCLDRGRPQLAISFLRAFVKRVQRDLSRNNPALAAQLSTAAQRVIDRIENP